MPRAIRHEYVDAVHRGNDRREIFTTDDGGGVGQTDWKIHAYVLDHLLLEPLAGPILNYGFRI